MGMGGRTGESRLGEEAWALGFTTAPQAIHRAAAKPFPFGWATGASGRASGQDQLGKTNWARLGQAGQWTLWQRINGLKAVV
ncbi:hypothetical protein UVI_02008810 [Ustilaginoidea virens]|uniref:Uncharacterized protein n=1 Tax=Ustilaginoidea virens TaxID=1159556 RepID=A0A1B5KUP7_USTVR|nr:hypothetical protein UVI_02008810 [Ustilaginoidea virens]